ncbi:MAG: hypothetical protein KDA52_09050, partial [Planctomycetaceae bacterium]|nr:hypothetical protein [Planctomycetaceae bacterium]
LRRLIDLYPGDTSGDNAYRRLASIHRRRSETDDEEQTLERYASYDSDATDVFVRLIELARERDDREALKRNAGRLMAVNPLTPIPHSALAFAAEQEDDHASAVTAYQSLLELSPNDPATVHFGLAKHLAATGESQEAKRHSLQALEVAPRYREAQRLLLRLTSIRPAEDSVDSPPQ